ncbi:MAG: GNAT family N-acetyltransferase [Deltaproteobacteria bacterium]|nr:GNAT family N-acetyltransferase [Deltaproteobacteria bacterium]
MNLAYLYRHTTDSFPLLANVEPVRSSDPVTIARTGSAERTDLQKQLMVRSMTREELDLTLSWAAKEGWNPGLDDASVFWSTERDGLFVAEVDGEIVGTGSVARYQPNTYFLGLFIVRPDLRGQGLGRRGFDHWRRVVSRRAAGPSREAPVIGMDAAPEMQRFYAANGFQFAHQQTRFCCTVGAWAQYPTLSHEAILDLSVLPFDMVEAFDRQHFGALRSDFLKQWIWPSSGAARAVVGADGAIKAMGVIRKAVRGWRVGPLFATETEAANLLLHDLCYRAEVPAGDKVYIDVPNVNNAAMELADSYQMEVDSTFGRMYFGDARPAVRWQQVYGITTLELG